MFDHHAACLLSALSRLLHLCAKCCHRRLPAYRVLLSGLARWQSPSAAKQSQHAPVNVSVRCVLLAVSMLPRSCCCALHSQVRRISLSSPRGLNCVVSPLTLGTLVLQCVHVMQRKALSASLWIHCKSADHGLIIRKTPLAHTLSNSGNWVNEDFFPEGTSFHDLNQWKPI